MVDEGLGQAVIRPVKVSVIIVNFQGGDMLPRCLDFVYGQRFSGSFDITVVDNGSVDQSIRLVQAHYPQTRVIFMGKNAGYCAALNRGISETDGEYVLTLNFDVELSPDFLEKAVEAFSGAPRIGSVSGRLWKSPPGRGTGLLDSTGIVMKDLFMADRGQGDSDRGQYDESDYVFGPSGAAALYKREMLEDIKQDQAYADVDFFGFVEDVDIAWRARLRGWRSVYTPAATAVHLRGVTRKSSARRRREYHCVSIRNRYWAIIKNLTGEQWKSNRGKIIRTELRGIARFIKHYGIGVTLSALWQALRGYRRFRAKRREIQSRVVAQRSMLDVFLFSEK